MNDSSKINIETPQILHDFKVLTKLFEFRFNILMKRSFDKLIQNSTKLSSFENFNYSQVFYLQKATLAYGELYVLGRFVDRIDVMEETETKNVLKELCVLYALKSLEKDLDILRECDYISSDFCYVIREEITRLCDLLKDQLIAIIDVIAPRDEILGAPLGYSDGRVIA